MNKREYARKYYLEHRKNNPEYAAKVRARHLLNKEKDNERQRIWRSANPDKVRSYKLKWHENNPGANSTIGWRRRLFRQFGLTPEQWDKMLSSQEGVCKICGQSEVRTRKDGELMRLSVDHCHSCLVVRGLLCGHCNATLGLFEKKEKIYKNIVEYLGDHECL